MSELIKIIPEQFNYQTKKVSGVFIAPSSTARVSTPSQTGTSTNNSVFNVTVPSKNSTIQDNVFIRYFVQVDFTTVAVPGQTPLNIGSTDGVRQYPMSQLISNLSCQMDSISVQVNTPGEVLCALDKYYLEGFEKSRDLGLCPNFPDGGLEYSDLVGTIRNPLAKGDLLWNHRGDFLINVISNAAGAGTAQVRFETSEPLFLLSPFGQKNITDEPGLTGISTLVLTVNFRSDLSRVWSHASSGQNITGITVSFYAAPELVTFFVQAPPSLELNISKNPLIVPYTSIIQFKSNTTQMTSGSTYQHTFQNLSLTSIPNSLFIFGQVSQTDKTFGLTDTFLSIENVNLTFGTIQSQFVQYTKQDLYNISVNNGLKFMSYSDFAQNVGSVIKIDLGKDVSLSNDGLLAPGSTGSFNIQLVVTFKNNYSNTRNFTFYCVTFQEGSITIRDQISVIEQSGITKENVFSASYQTKDVLVAKGGNLLSSLGKLIPLVTNAIEVGTEIGEDIAPLIIGSGMKGGKSVGGKVIGGKVMGGKILSKEDLIRLQKK